VLEMLFGFGQRACTAEEVAQTMGLTRERVRQIKEQALKHINERANIDVLKKYL
jgi:RNA polymerase primary sigma factor